MITQIYISLQAITFQGEFFNLDHKKSSALLILDMKESSYNYLFKDLCEDNYLQKMRHCLYLEEIAQRNAFDRYEIKCGHFEDCGEFLRLEVNGLHERRPSLAIGDQIAVTELSSGKQLEVEHRGFIHQVSFGC